MDYNFINKMKKNVLLRPVRENVESLLQASSNLDQKYPYNDIDFLVSLLMGNETKCNDQPITYVNGNTNNGTPEGTEIISTCVPDPMPFFLKIPANAQWSFINGLGDMEWIKNYCVRQCLEGKIIHSQVLPCSRKFTVTITGQFQRPPNPFVNVPFHSLKYKAHLESKSNNNEWTSHQYECVLHHNERLENANEEILYELEFDASAGDYVLEIGYFI